MKVNVNDKVETKESLTNNKPWFNGMKQFSSVKVNPPQKKKLVLKINVSDSVAAESDLV